MALYDSVQTVINGAAVELGLDASVDVLASSNSAFVQLRYLLNAAGSELALMYDWQQLQKEYTVVTNALDSGDYPLPADFDHMIDQTGWDRTNKNPLSGPLTPQVWQYLKGVGLGSQAVFVSFRLKEGVFSILPNNPVPGGLTIAFEYIKDTWVSNAAGSTFYTSVQAVTDLVLYHKSLITKYLKVKFLEAKGFDSEKARDDFAYVFDAVTGQSKGAPVLNAGGRQGFPYLDMYRNVAGTGYGL